MARVIKIPGVLLGHSPADDIERVLEHFSRFMGRLDLPERQRPPVKTSILSFCGSVDVFYNRLLRGFHPDNERSAAAALWLAAKHRHILQAAGQDYCEKWRKEESRTGSPTTFWGMEGMQNITHEIKAGYLVMPSKDELGQLSPAAKLTFLLISCGMLYQQLSTEEKNFFRIS